MITPPSVDVGSRWILPSGNVIEVIPSVTDEHVSCKYRKTQYGKFFADAGVNLRRDFIEKHGRALN